MQTGRQLKCYNAAVIIPVSDKKEMKRISIYYEKLFGAESTMLLQWSSLLHNFYTECYCNGVHSYIISTLNLPKLYNLI